jgi:hypothetical protein
LLLGDGPNSIFATRRKELDAIEAGQAILSENGKLNARLATSVKQLVGHVHSDMDVSSWQARQKIALTTKVMSVLGLLALIASALFVWLYVGRNILPRSSVQCSFSRKAIWRLRLITAVKMMKLP